MLSIFTVCFFGHRYIENFQLAEERVYNLIRKLVCKKEYVDFLVGRDGDFDQIVSSAIIRAKKELDYANCSHTLVMAYPRADYKNNFKAYEDYYNSIEICKTASIAYPKAAFQIRNRNMVDRANLCVFFVKNKNGGAWQTMCYAIKQQKSIVNLADLNYELQL